LGTLSLILGAELRYRWRSWLALAALIAIAGGFVMGAAAAGRRTAAAFPRFVKAYGFDLEVYSTQPEPKVHQLPVVSGVTSLRGAFFGQPTCRCRHPINPTNFSIGVVTGGDPHVYKLLSGHMPDPSDPDQVLASFTLQQDYGVHLGSIIRVPFYTTSQGAAVSTATGALPVPKGPTVAFRVVGLEAGEGDFPTGSAPSYELVATKAFARDLMSRTPFGYVYFIRLHGGANGTPDFVQQAQRAHLITPEFGYQSMDAQAAAVESSVHPQAVGWWALAVLGGVVALAVVGQALFRQSAFESRDYPTMAAIGADRRLLVQLGMARTLVVAVIGACGAVALPTALSPLAPLGEARTAEVSTGFSFDVLVMFLGAVATVLVVLALGIWPALRASRRLRVDERPEASRPSAVVGALARLGAPPSALIGVRHAVERRSGDATVPVGSALVGTVLAVTALCGTAVFGASLAHLTKTPRLYGDNFQLNISDPFGSRGGPDLALLTALEHDMEVTGITRGYALEVSINKTPVGALAGTALRGQLPFSAVTGHLPDGDGQVGLGIATMRQVGAHLGSLVDVGVTLPSGQPKTVPFRVVSQVSFPVIGGTVHLGTGALFTIAGLEDAVCPSGQAREACGQAMADSSGIGGGILASVVPGPRGTSDVNHYLDTYQSIVALPIVPTSLINFGEAVNFPLIFGAILATFGAATLVHLLLVSVSRRRRDIALLKVLGFVNVQVGSVVAWQATTLAVVGAIIGAPLGILIGRAVWDTFANNLGAVPVPVVPLWLLTALLAGVVMVANLIAVPPALVATRSKPDELLRSQ